MNKNFKKFFINNSLKIINIKTTKISTGKVENNSGKFYPNMVIDFYI